MYRAPLAASGEAAHCGTGYRELYKASPADRPRRGAGAIATAPVRDNPARDRRRAPGRRATAPRRSGAGPGYAFRSGRRLPALPPLRTKALHSAAPAPAPPVVVRSQTPYVVRPQALLSMQSRSAVITFVLTIHLL